MSFNTRQRIKFKDGTLVPFANEAKYLGCHLNTDTNMSKEIPSTPNASALLPCMSLAQDPLLPARGASENAQDRAGATKKAAPGEAGAGKQGPGGNKGPQKNC